ncbi:MAG: hypothetical protein ACRYFU_00395 [Janthinobacterium lividum]
MIGSLGGRHVQWAVVMWVAVLAVAAAIWIFIPSQVVGWDLDVIQRAIESLRAGHDPYLDSIAAQREYFRHVAPSAIASPPFSYVYSPITLPLLRFVGRFPLVVAGVLYWTLYGIGGLTVLWLGLQLTEPRERQIFAVLAPALMFFPGLLESGILVSGNIAFLLYGGLFAAAWRGWRRGTWNWFYVAALVASCFKPPMLSMLAIPIFSDRKQWLPSCLTGGIGLALFCLQPVLFPSEFRNFMQTLNLMFDLQHDYSGSPAGLLAGFFYGGARFHTAFVFVYLLFGIPTVVMLRVLSLRYFEGELSFRRWIPVMLLGVLLLNPRINEYDAGAVTLPLAVVAWRVFSRVQERTQALLTLTLLFLGANIFVAVTSPAGPVTWKCTQGVLLLSLFWSGSWMLFREVRERRNVQTAALVNGVAVQDVLPGMAINVERR